jgi:hypothetical protein
MRLYETHPKARIPMPRRKRRNDFQREDDLLAMVEMHAQGRPIAEICARFKISRAQAHKDLQGFYEFMKNDRSQKKREKRDKLLIKIDIAERELWEAWHRSKKDKEVQTQEKTSATEGGGVSQERSKASLRSEGRLPHCPYMAELGKCWEKRARLEGINDPDKVDVEVVKPIQIIRIKDAPPRQDLPPSGGQEHPPTPGAHPPTPGAVAEDTAVAAAVVTPKKNKAGLKIVAKPMPPRSDKEAST